MKAAKLMGLAEQPPYGSLEDQTREEAIWLRNKIKQSELSPFSEIRVVTPTLARMMLAKNPANRKVKPAKLKQYINDMKESRWNFNMENIIFAKSGELNDGQHRLQAVVESGIPQKFNITFGADRGTRFSIDTGAMRGAQDHLAISGFAHSTRLAGVARAVIAYETVNGETLGRSNDVSTQSVLERVGHDRLLVECANFAATHQRKLQPVGPTAILGMVYYIASKLDKRKADEFMLGLRDGLNLTADSPIYAVKSRTATAKLSNVERAELLLRGFLLFARGIKTGSIKLHKKLPKMEIK